MALTPISSATSYATPADLISFKDIRALADLLEDQGQRVGGTQPNPTTVEADPNLQVALNWASGEIESAMMVGQKYQPVDLNSLTGMSLYLLKGLTCDLAFWKLLTRRYPTTGITEEYRAAMERLERLRLGERIFGFQESMQAGLPANQFFTQQTINTLFLSTTQAIRFYGNRNKEARLGAQ